MNNPSPMPPPRKPATAHAETARDWIVHAILATLAAVTLLPFAMTLVLSQKTNGEIMHSLWTWPEAAHPEYYVEAARALVHYIANSLTIGAAIVTGVLIFGSLSGYVFARLQFAGKGVLFTLIIVLMMIPGVLTLVPAFMWMKEFPFLQGNDWLGRGGSGLLNTRWVFILPYLSGGQVLAIYLFRTFYETLPEDLFAAARLDGAGEFRVWRHLAIPLSLPIFATVAVITFIGVYNDYVWPLVTITDRARQVFAVGVTQFGATGNLKMGPTFAGYVVGAVPMILVFIFGMRYYVEGMTRGGLKA
ncbi:MAG: carbohydrate ABC transporter permease [bacterium]|nr:carbohydrate ABC transporter permease [bacterium]